MEEICRGGPASGRRGGSLSSEVDRTVDGCNILKWTEKWEEAHLRATCKWGQLQKGTDRKGGSFQSCPAIIKRVIWLLSIFLSRNSRDLSHIF